MLPSILARKTLSPSRILLSHKYLSLRLDINELLISALDIKY